MGAGNNGPLVFRETGALVKQRADLALELAHGPVALEAFVFIEGAFERVANADEFDELSPGEMQHRIR